MEFDNILTVAELRFDCTRKADTLKCIGMEIFSFKISPLEGNYRSRATAGRGHNSKIAFLAVKLPHKKHIKTFLA